MSSAKCCLFRLDLNVLSNSTGNACENNDYSASVTSPGDKESKSSLVEKAKWNGPTEPASKCYCNICYPSPIFYTFTQHWWILCPHLTPFPNSPIYKQTYICINKLIECFEVCNNTLSILVPLMSRKQIISTSEVFPVLQLIPAGVRKWQLLMPWQRPSLTQ